NRPAESDSRGDRRADPRRPGSRGSRSAGRRRHRDRQGGAVRPGGKPDVLPSRLTRPPHRKEHRTAMPLWTIHHTPGLFSDAEKHELASRIADHYEAIGLPRFYAVTVFQEARPGNFYVGGEPVPVGARIVIDHIARHNAGPEARRRTAQ